MKCPFCGGGDDRVVDSREGREGEVIRRRRECVTCGRRFTSYETIEEIELARQHGLPTVGIGHRCYIRNAIVDKNCRIGDDVRIVSRRVAGSLRSAVVKIHNRDYCLLPMNCSTISRRCGRARCSAM